VQNGAIRPAPPSCAEPQAISDYLDQRGIDENSSHEEVQSALRDMRVSAQHGPGSTTNPGRARAPCANCSQLIANLAATYGEPQPSNIAPGCTGPTGNTGEARFTPPPAGRPGHQSHQAALNAYPGPP